MKTKPQHTNRPVGRGLGAGCVTAFCRLWAVRPLSLLSQFYRGRSGAVTVEYALGMLIAAAMLIGVETKIFRPAAVEIFKNFMGFIAPPYP